MGSICDTDIANLIEWCDDCDVYHEYTLWRKPNGHLYLTDGSGDVSPIYRKDADAMIADQPAAWKEYYQHVAETGDDYLHELIVDRTEQQTWVLRLGQHDGRVYLIGGSKQGSDRWFGYKDLPQDVYEFGTVRFDYTGVGVERSPFLLRISSLDEIEDSGHVKGLGDGFFECNIAVRLPEADIQEAIKQRAAALAKEE